MLQRRVNIRQLVIVVLLAAITTAIASLTIGRDIYNGFAGHGVLSFAIVSLAGYLFFLGLALKYAILTLIFCK